MKPTRSHLPLVLLGLLSPLSAQAPAKKGKAPEASKAATPAPVNAAAPAVADQADDITVIKPVPYQPALKRDPFASPSDDSTKNQGNLVEDIAVKGVVSGPDGKLLAVIVDSHGKSTVVPVGFRLRDGEIVGIDSRGVTFHQWELNTTNRSAYRTVVKTFKNEEAK
ncbi:MAG TPA: hypothetical protein VFF76_05485 [Holophagaceae bacterium]|jgi:hypothetical protein|nr:hypothetical protein [Holophagaceae bacterium]